MAFHHSSQKKCWTFASATQLHAMREVACVEAINRIQRMSPSLKLDTLLSVEEEVSWTIKHVAYQARATIMSTLLQDIWLKYYEGKLIEYHESLQLPLKVKVRQMVWM
jgi:hypothetical protein